MELNKSITPEMIESWKAQHGANKIKKAILVDGDGVPVMAVVVRSPDRTVMGEFEKHNYTNPAKSKEILVNACLLSDKETVVADTQLFYSAYAALMELAPLAKATIENL